MVSLPKVSIPLQTSTQNWLPDITLDKKNCFSLRDEVQWTHQETERERKLERFLSCNNIQIKKF